MKQLILPIGLLLLMIAYVIYFDMTLPDGAYTSMQPGRCYRYEAENLWFIENMSGIYFEIPCP